ncbi:MAG: hypothetical protein JXA24_03795 [Proteobacteria bacterium]|nr:hypothetical protein [Pseudomonadota bacterium]
MGRLYSCIIILMIGAIAAGSVEAGVRRRVSRAAPAAANSAKFEARGQIKIEPLPELAHLIFEARVAEPYSAVLTATGGKGYGYAWGHSVLPVGLLLQMDAEEEGKIYVEGVPEKEGAFEIRIKATDVVEPSIEGEFVYTLTVSPHPAMAE